MSADRDEDIRRVVEMLGDRVDRFDRSNLEVFLEEIFNWNPQLGLVSKRETPDVVGRLVCRSLDLWDFIAPHASPRPGEKTLRIADIGSGGGFPGIAWRLVAPEHEFVLIERKSRRAFFIERVLTRLQLDRVRVIEGDVDELVRRPSVAGTFDVAAVIAVAAPGELADSISRLLRGGGLLVGIRPLSETEIPHTLSHDFRLLAQDRKADGQYVLYQRA